MGLIGVFGQGPMGGAFAAPHVAVIKATPDILRSIYEVGGITGNALPATVAANFRYLGAGAPEPTFVCLDALCRRVLPTHVSQLDHNVPVAGLAAMNLGMAAIGGVAHVDYRHFVHRTATNANQHRNNVWVGPGGHGYGFAVYYTFGTDTFHVVMERGGTGQIWRSVIGRAHSAQIHWLIRGGFTLALVGGTPAPHSYNFVAATPGIPLGANVGRLDPVAFVYAPNLVAPGDLANLQFLCPPCNAAKNAGGVPLNHVTLY